MRTGTPSNSASYTYDRTANVLTSTTATAKKSPSQPPYTGKPADRHLVGDAQKKKKKTKKHKTGEKPPSTRASLHLRPETANGSDQHRRRRQTSPENSYLRGPAGQAPRSRTPRATTVSSISYTYDPNVQRS